MKEHVQKPGVRQWAGEDLIELQAEPLRVVEGFFSEYGNCVIKGCTAAANEDGTHDISSGLLGLWGMDAEGNRVYKTVPFSGVSGVALPVYFTLSHSVVERAYADNKVKPIAYDYRAAVSTVQPESGDYLALTEAGAIRFKDVIQDAGHRFMTDAERAKLNGIETEANKYIHPDVHPAGMITEDTAHRFFTDTERTKLNDIEAEANRYVHPSEHPASMVRFADGATFQEKLNEGSLRGQDGAPGLQGLTGPIGPIGPQGIQGPAGLLAVMDIDVQIFTDPSPQYLTSGGVASMLNWQELYSHLNNGNPVIFRFNDGDRIGWILPNILRLDSLDMMSMHFVFNGNAAGITFRLDGNHIPNQMVTKYVGLDRVYA